MGMTTDRNGALVRVPKILKMNIYPEGDGAELVLTVEGATIPFVPGTGTIKFSKYEYAENAMREMQKDVEEGRDPDLLVSMVKAGPDDFPSTKEVVIFIVLLVAMMIMAS